MTNSGPPGPVPGGPIDPRLARPAPAGAPSVPRQQPAPQPAAPAAPAYPPSFTELLEGSAIGLFTPGDAYGALGARPEPNSADAALAMLAWGAAMVAVLCAFAWARLNAESWGVLPLAGGALGGLVLSVPLGFAGAAVLHALGAMSGGQGGFARSVEAAALLGPAPALLCAALFAPDPAWMAAPTLYATWLAVNAVEKLHDAPVGQAWMILGFCGALAAGSQVLGREKLTLALVRVENAATVMTNNPNAREEHRPAARLDAPLSTPASRPTGDRMAGDPGTAGPIEADPLAAGTPAQRSSLDYLRQPGQPDEAGGDIPIEQDPRMVQAKALQQNGVDLIENLRRTIGSNPEAMRGVPPQQAQALQGLLDQFQKNMAGGQGKMSPEQTQALIKQVMSALGKNAPQGLAPQTGGPPKAPRRRAAPPPPSGD
ncbi:MAG: hypothetical protein HY928_11325 [Elusimicrobia bacterium]|nr:hypothetical protein [Elusimicrobiota bacterium]